MANANYNHKSLKRFTLSEGINATTTSIPVTAVLDPPDVPFVALIKNKKYPDGVDDPEAEFVLVTVAGASPWTATRGVESTAVSHDIGNYDLVPTTTAALMNALAAIAEVVSIGNGAPTAAEADGSLYIQQDLGGALFVRKSSAWEEVTSST